MARRFGINPKTVAKWRKRSSATDLPAGPKAAKSTSLSVEDEAIVVAFRRHTPRRSMTASTPCSRRYLT